MGTRNLVCVVKDGEFRVAQYGQWDGYPTGQGTTIVNFLLNQDLERFADQVDRVRHLSEDEVEERWKAAGADDTGLVSLDISKKFQESNMHLSRDCGAGILEYVLSADDPEVYMSLDFAGDSLYCEYAYVVDLDNNVLEVYKGFNQGPVDPSNRFAFLAKSENKYQPVELFRSFKFSELTESTMKDLEKEMYSHEG